jgi:hypothetical protein
LRCSSANRTTLPFSALMKPGSKSFNVTFFATMRGTVHHAYDDDVGEAADPIAMVLNIAENEMDPCPDRSMMDDLEPARRRGLARSRVVVPHKAGIRLHAGWIGDE